MSNYRLRSFSAYNDTIRFSYSITKYSFTLKLLPNLFSKPRDRLWEERNKAKFDGFINAVALKVVDEFDSNVTIEVVDSNNNKLTTKLLIKVTLSIKQLTLTEDIIQQILWD